MNEKQSPPEYATTQTTSEHLPMVVNNSNYRRPYLNLKERLSQVWLNYFSIFIILIAIKLYIFQKSIDSSMNQAKEQTYVVCESVENYASSLVSLPHYLARSSNVLITKSLTVANHALVSGLQLILTGSENMILFAIELTIGTYVCVLTATVDGAVNAALNATEAVIDVANGTIVSLAGEIQDGLDNVAVVVNKVLNTYDTVENFFTGNDDDDADSSINNVSLTVNSLKNWKIDGSINDKLEGLRDDLPDFEDVQNYTESLISKPFDSLKREVELRLNDEFSSDELIVPEKKTLRFCKSSPEIDDFYQNSSNLLHKIATIMIVILILISVGFMAFESYKIVKQWLRIQKNVKALQDINNAVNATSDSKNHATLEIIDSIEHRYTSIVAGFLSKSIGGENIIKRNNSKWVINYITSNIALSILLLGLAGILAFILQLIMLSCLSSISTDDVKNGFSRVSDDISQSINESVYEWANDTNLYLQDQEDSMNGDMLDWVNTSTYSINETIEGFITTMNEKLDDVFGSTPLYDPISAIVGCVLTRKLVKVQEALTWVHDNSQISLPRVNASDLMSAMDSGDEKDDNDSELSEYIDAMKDTLRNTRDEIIKQYKKSLLLELYISIALISLWVLLILNALIILFINEKSIERKNRKDESFIKPTFGSELTISNPKAITVLKTLPLPTSPIFTNRKDGLGRVPPLIPQFSNQTYMKSFNDLDFTKMEKHKADEDQGSILSSASPTSSFQINDDNYNYHDGYYDDQRTISDEKHPYDGAGQINHTLYKLVNDIRTTSENNGTSAMVNKNDGLSSIASLASTGNMPAPTATTSNNFSYEVSITKPLSVYKRDTNPSYSSNFEAGNVNTARLLGSPYRFNNYTGIWNQGDDQSEESSVVSGDTSLENDADHHEESPFNDSYSEDYIRSSPFRDPSISTQKQRPA